MGHGAAVNAGQDGRTGFNARDGRSARKFADLPRLIHHVRNVANEVSAVLNRLIDQHEASQGGGRWSHDGM